MRPANAKALLLRVLSFAVLLVAGCRQDMHNQPKYVPLRGSTFWADGRSARLPVANTVARGNLRDDEYFYTGKINGQEGDKFPLPVTKELLARGQQRFNIYCTPCHSRVGDGDGMIVQRGLKRPPSYHDEKLKKAPIGHFYDVMTNGFGAMLNYSAQITPADRWAIAAYIRVLQLSQDAKLTDVPESERQNIQAPVLNQPMPTGIPARGIEPPPSQPSQRNNTNPPQTKGTGR